MALYNYLDHEGCLLNSSTMKLLRQAALENLPCQLLVPSSTVAWQVRKELADEGLAFNIDVTTPLAWAQSVWGRVGDGRKPASLGDGRMAAWKILGTSSSKGLVALVASLAQKASALICAQGYDESLLSEQQKQAAAQALQVAKALGAQDLITASDLLAALPGAIEAAGTEPESLLVVSGFTHIDPETALFLGHLATVCDVHYACSAPQNLAGGAALSSAGTVSRCANQAGAQVLPFEEVPDRVQLNRRTAELSQLVQEAFSEEGASIEPEGSVVLLEAAGSTAEAELMARALAQVADEGADHVIAVTRDPQKLWGQLSDKLVARGVGVRASWTQRASQDKAVQIFLGYCVRVSQLVALKDQWQWAQSQDLGSDSLEEAQKLVARSASADRRWWPPRDLVDFLLSSFSGVDQAEAYKLDQAWRRSRMVSPAQVLKDLHEAAASNACLKVSLDALEAGDWVQAAAALQPLAQKAKEPEVFSALGLLAQTAYELQIAHLTPDDPQLHRDLMLSLLEVKQLPCSFERGVFEGDVRCVVDILTPASLGALRPQSQEVVLWAQQTSAENPVSSPRGALPELLDLIGIPQPVSPDEVARAQAFHIWTLPTHRLLIERSRRDSEADETHPSPALSELLSLYKKRLPQESLGEDQVVENLAATGHSAEPQAIQEASSVQLLSGHVLELALQKRDRAGESPVLSPTALEHYMACPRCWFFEYGLAANVLDAEFSPLEKGNFVHRILERTLRAARDQGIGSEKEMIELIKRNAALAVAEGVLDPTNTSMPIPHSFAEEQDLATIESRLERLVTDQWLLFDGFEPQDFECRFGFDDQEIRYGGASFRGYIDRIDVNSQGQALIVDYKSNSADKRFLLPSSDSFSLDQWTPRYIQAYLYATVLKQIYPQLDPVGCLYLLTGAKPGQEGVVDMSVLGPSLHPASDDTLSRMNPETYNATFDEVLQRAEECAAKAIGRMFAGDVYANPVDSKICNNCPVVGCDKRK